MYLSGVQVLHYSLEIWTLIIYLRQGGGVSSAILAGSSVSLILYFSVRFLFFDAWHYKVNISYSYCLYEQ